MPRAKEVHLQHASEEVGRDGLQVRVRDRDPDGCVVDQEVQPPVRSGAQVGDVLSSCGLTQVGIEIDGCTQLGGQLVAGVLALEACQDEMMSPRSKCPRHCDANTATGPGHHSDRR